MKIGNRGEELAAEFLLDHGYEVVQRNFRYRNGEIDIIAYGKGMYIFVEVKTRNTKTYGLPREAVDYHKQVQIYNTAKMYLHKNHLYDVSVRFDVIEVYLENGLEIVHIKNAFNGNDVEG
ncbi:YraN family protein [Peptoniphilus sp. KCTC 25270]|uniref:YraN family protein n=1 Tax=Peptoniphilus sp. KCTC 25270 TaxID=2897414 RepID=UPI001E596264|nr:YraN family protein [Peptoniphilus sp. KCTC 25270]MCD1147082.1 YraN family protein [Peptoniphilus sp. KCTC 25270]